MLKRSVCEVCQPSLDRTHRNVEALLHGISLIVLCKSHARPPSHKSRHSGIDTHIFVKLIKGVTEAIWYHCIDSTHTPPLLFAATRTSLSFFQHKALTNGLLPLPTAGAGAAAAPPAVAAAERGGVPPRSVPAADPAAAATAASVPPMLLLLPQSHALSLYLKLGCAKPW